MSFLTPPHNLLAMDSGSLGLPVSVLIGDLALSLLKFEFTAQITDRDGVVGTAR